MRRAFVLGGVVAAIAGGAILAAASARSPDRAAFSFLFAYFSVFGVVVGALFVLGVGNASDARWFVVTRRLVEHVTAVLPLLAVLFVPVFAAARRVYPWARSETGRLTRSAFGVRGAIYLVVLLAIGERLRAVSLRQDDPASDAGALRRRLVAWSAVALPLMALTLTGASFDWAMSLEPSWFSDVYGVYVFAGGFLAALGVLGVALVISHRGGLLPARVSAEHFHAVGRLELAMVIFWAYIGWAQLLLVWIADQPLEVPWYIARWHGGWESIGLALLVVHFVLPFAFLLGRTGKRRALPLFCVSGWLVIAHFLDVYYLIVPARSPGRLDFALTDLAACVGLVGASVAFGAARAAHVPFYPLRDPLLEKSIEYEAA
ncbi:MAG TPA: hypothetical protein VHE30_29455 [Polyangiaceae bacterium]|nr:hypothetical protein [Polyangiaceae bacterium]